MLRAWSTVACVYMWRRQATPGGGPSPVVACEYEACMLHHAMVVAAYGRRPRSRRRVFDCSRLRLLCGRRCPCVAVAVRCVLLGSLAC